MKFLTLCLFLLGAPAFAGAVTGPDPKLTPGSLCTETDPNFDKVDYPEKVARCKRNVNDDEKTQIAHEYGEIPKADWHLYEFDHLIPLCAGGANDVRNLWPQPLAEAHEKDKLEDEICQGMKSGALTQREAVDKVHAWFEQRGASL